MEIKYRNTLDDELKKASKIQWRYANKKPFLPTAVTAPISAAAWFLTSGAQMAVIF
jgi:hypothetical protein